MNVAALLLLTWLYGKTYSIKAWCAVFLACSLTISGALLLWVEGFSWYVGLSGVLHGVLVAALAGGWREHRLESAVLATGLIAKLVYEQFIGAVPGSEATAGGAVVVDAHLYGALGGVFIGAALVAVRRL